MKRALLLCLLACSCVVPSALVQAADGPIPAFRLTPPPPSDRMVRPFDGSLGRPCGYRWRATPSGTRKVRVCY